MLKYLNRDSTHSCACFKAIPWGVFGRLAKLTSITRRKLKQGINHLYPDHYKALEKANLAPAIPPTLKEILTIERIGKSKKDERKAKS